MNDAVRHAQIEIAEFINDKIKELEDAGLSVFFIDVSLIEVTTYGSSKKEHLIRFVDITTEESNDG